MTHSGEATLSWWSTYIEPACSSEESSSLRAEATADSSVWSAAIAVVDSTVASTAAVSAGAAVCVVPLHAESASADNPNIAIIAVSFFSFI